MPLVAYPPLLFGLGAAGLQVTPRCPREGVKELLLNLPSKPICNALRSALAIYLDNVAENDQIARDFSEGKSAQTRIYHDLVRFEALIQTTSVHAGKDSDPVATALQ